MDNYELHRKLRFYRCQFKKFKQLYEDCSAAVPCDPTTITLNENFLRLVQPCSEDINFTLQDQDLNTIPFTLNGTTIQINCEGGGGGECEPVHIYFNDNPFAEVSCGEDFFFYVTDQNDNPVTPLSVSGNTIQVNIPECCDETSVSFNNEKPIDLDCGDTNFLITDTDETPLTILSVVDGVIRVDTDCADCEDATAVLIDTASPTPNIISTTSIASGASANIVAPDGNIVLKRSNGATLRTVSVRSNQTKDETIADTTVQLQDSAGNNIGSANSYLAESSSTLPAPDGNIQLNSIDVGTVRSNATRNIQVLQGGIPTGSWDGTSLIIPVRASGVPQTGQTATYGVGDDGDQRRGFLSAFVTLPASSPNIWGRFERFTGVTGGYHDGVQFFDVNGTALGNDATAANLAFPDSIVVNWSTHDLATNRVLGFCRTQIGGATDWTTKRAACLAFSTSLYPSNWKAGNFNEYNEFLKHGDSALFAYPPFNASSATGIGGIFGLSGSAFWTFTTHNAAGTTMLQIAPNPGTAAKFTNGAITGTTQVAHPVRYFTISGTTLT